MFRIDLEQVDPKGMLKTKRPLRVVDAWDFLNEHAFNDELVRPSLKVSYRIFQKSNGKRHQLLGAYGDSIQYGKTIFISHLHDENPVESLFHEMVHQYQDEVLDSDYTTHGKEFKEIYAEAQERLCASLGLL